jgi:hypothetical protein
LFMLVFVSSMYSLLFCEKRSMCFFNSMPDWCGKCSQHWRLLPKGNALERHSQLQRKDLESSWRDESARVAKGALLHLPEDNNGPCSFHGQPSSQLPSQPAWFGSFASMHRYRASWLGHFAPVDFPPTIFAPSCY